MKSVTCGEVVVWGSVLQTSDGDTTTKNRRNLSSVWVFNYLFNVEGHWPFIWICYFSYLTCSLCSYDYVTLCSLHLLHEFFPICFGDKQNWDIIFWQAWWFNEDLGGVLVVINNDKVSAVSLRSFCFWCKCASSSPDQYPYFFSSFLRGRSSAIALSIAILEIVRSWVNEDIFIIEERQVRVGWAIRNIKFYVGSCT